MASNKVAVVLLTYNGKQYLPELFESLGKTRYAKPWQLIVVDNASTDGTTGWLQNKESRIKNKKEKILYSLFVILNSQNFGFAAGNNIGMRKALADGAEHIVLLNQDTVVDPAWLTHLVEAAEKDETIGAVQARLMLWDKKDIVNSLGNEIHFLGFGYSGGYNSQLSVVPPTPKLWRAGSCQLSEIAYASGAAVLYRVKAIEDVGLLDESFFMYHEDLDIGWRLWRAGWKSVLTPKAVVYHKYEFSRSIQKYYYMERNRFLVLLENYSIATLLLIAPALCVMELGMLFFTVRSGWWKEKLRAYGYFLRPATWGMIVRERRAKQKTFRRPERELLRRFVGTIAFQDMRNFVLEYIANPIFTVYWGIVKRLILW